MIADEMEGGCNGLMRSSDAPCHTPGLPCAQVLYTDVDTIFMEDINSCSLPSPRILSAAGEVTTLFANRTVAASALSSSAEPLCSILVLCSGP